MELDKEWQSGKSFAQSNMVMFDNEVDADVTFAFPGSHEKIKAHMFILKSRSHVFFVMFGSGLHDPGKDIEIEEIEPDIFKDFLRFLYCGELTITANNALHLLYTAQKYETLVLKAKCLEYLEKNITVTTVSVILDQTVFYNEDRLRDMCLEFLSKDKRLEALTHHHVSKETMNTIVDCKAISAMVLILFKACDMWADLECRNKGLEVNGENKRNMLGSILTKIPLSSLSQEQIASEVSPCGLLAVQDELALLRSVILGVKESSEASPEVKANAELMPSPEVKTSAATKESPEMKPSSEEKASPEVNAGFMANGFPELIPSPEMAENSELTTEDLRTIHVKLPSYLLGKFNNTSKFMLDISSTKKFKLLGLQFSYPGRYALFLEPGGEHTFLVWADDSKKYLETPVTCDVNSSLTIRNVAVPPRTCPQPTRFNHHIEGTTVTFKMELTMIYSPPPFKSLLVELL